MAFPSEIISIVINVVTKPFTLFKQSCLLGVKTILFLVHIWTELIMTTVYFYLNLFQKMISWIFSFVSLPFRVLTALQREKQLEMQLRYMQIQLEDLAWDKKEIQHHLHSAIREHRMMDLMLAEIEGEHDKAIAKMESLVGELEDLKRENLRLREVTGKDYWNFRGEDENGSGQKGGFPEKNSTPSRNTSHNGSGIGLQDILMNTATWSDDSKNKPELQKLLKSGSKASATASFIQHPITAKIASRSSDVTEALVERREVAMSQSVFSAVMSLLVGMIVWEAEDPCMPLVVALFIVVGISLKSVVQFFSTLHNKPASDAVALLSFNWFILGTLTYPTLPRIAHMLSPFASSFLDHFVNSLGLSLFFAPVL